MEPTSQSSSSTIPIAIVAGFGLIALAIYFSGIGKSTTAAPLAVQQEASASNSQKSKANIKPIDETDYIRGNPNAPIVIVEYSDYDCPFCKQFHETMNQIMNEYGVGGKVAWVYRQFPIDQLHPNASRISKAALCVGEIGGNEAFWEFSDKIFAGRSVNEPTNISKLSEYATSVGVDSTAYNACMESDRQAENVAESIADGASAGIQGTPNSFVIVGNQQAPLEGAQPYVIVKQIVQNLIDQLEGKEITAPEVDETTEETANEMGAIHGN